MDDIYGIHSATADEYADEVLISAGNLMFPVDYHEYRYNSMVDDLQQRIPVFGSEELGFQCSVVSESASVDVPNRREGDEDEQASTAIKAKIVSHPSYPKLIDAYIDCQKIGAPPQIAFLLDEIRREKGLSKQDPASLCSGVDPELDQFMENYFDILVKYKSDLSKPFDEATSFLIKIEAQLQNLCDGAPVSSDEELSRGDEIELQEEKMKMEDRKLKDKLLQMYGSHISSLKLEFSKKKKKGKLPKEARQILVQWWTLHSKWPYPTEADKIAMAKSTGLDQKQINNWFINQRKRHWKSPDNVRMAMMDNVSGQEYIGD